MKKLMIATAALCAAVSCNALESANVVGYASPSLGDNANLAGAPFDMVGDEGMDIQNIRPDGDDMYGGGVSLKLLNSGLGDLAEYFYLPAEEAPDGETAGWYEEDYTTLVDKTFDPGEGFILMNNLENGKSTYSGQVMVGKPTWEVAPNANLAGNITPIDLDIQNIKVGSGVDGEGNVADTEGTMYGGAFSIKLLNSGLGDLVEYFYLPAEEAPDGETAGWYLDDYTTLVDQTFGPSVGFVVMCNLDAGFVQIPAALTAE